MPGWPSICTCGKLIPHGVTCICQAEALMERRKRFDATRPSASQRGYSSKWRTARDEFLTHFCDCAICGYPATIVDHIKPHKGDYKLFWDKSNWQSLCKPCHDRHKQKLERGIIDEISTHTQLL